jgi:hypothetical protein
LDIITQKKNFCSNCDCVIYRNSHVTRYARWLTILTNIYCEIFRSHCVKNIPRPLVPTYFPFHPSHILTLMVDNLCRRYSAPLREIREWLFLWLRWWAIRRGHN